MSWKFFEEQFAPRELLDRDFETRSETRSDAVEGGAKEVAGHVAANNPSKQMITTQKPWDGDGGKRGVDLLVTEPQPSHL